MVHPGYGDNDFILRIFDFIACSDVRM